LTGASPTAGSEDFAGNLFFFALLKLYGNLALSEGKAAKVAHQLSPCFSAFAFANAAPELNPAFRMKDNTAPTIRGGFFLLLALMFSLLSMTSREQQCNRPR
jgi:hypothetical protein